ncbi:transposase, MuDR, MULE transposase domain protein [Tanacetum coccineum]|uniref:Transposase, MuDR, MULE transposase domain protein n=1 Tax=Tanacetum coccineum TaxID=301880 RepID=A0ABQ5BQH1_9ASTR
MESVKIRVCKGGAWERVDGALEYMPLNCVKRTLILPLLSSYSCLLEAVSERLEIDANSDFMVTYNSDNDIVEVCDDLEVNEFMEFVVKSSRIVTLCIVESSVNGRQSSNSGSNQQSNFIHATPFEIFFLAIDAVIRTFVLHMRPLIIIDGAHLKDHLTIISDGAVSIASAIKNVFPNAFHGRCCRHLLMNLREKCPRFISKEELFWKACKAYRISDFEERFSTLRDWLPSIANKLDMIGLENLAKSSGTLNIDKQQDISLKSPTKGNQQRKKKGQWQLSGLPCGHLIAVMRHLRQSSANQFAFSCFKTSVWRASYNEVIYDVGHPSEWDKPDGLIIVLPPVM